MRTEEEIKTPSAREVPAPVEILLGPDVGYSTPKMIKAARGKACPYCHETMRGHGSRRASRDHIRPRIQGGKLTRGNCLIVCQVCNGDKGSRTLEEWLVFLVCDADQRAAIIAELIESLRSAPVNGRQTVLKTVESERTGVRFLSTPPLASPPAIG